jgi:hypothetical protein
VFETFFPWIKICFHTCKRNATLSKNPKIEQVLTLTTEKRGVNWRDSGESYVKGQGNGCQANHGALCGDRGQAGELTQVFVTEQLDGRGLFVFLGVFVR